MSKVVEDVRNLLTDLDLYKIPVNPVIICDRLDIVYQEKAYQTFDGTLIVDGNKQLIGVNSNIQEQSRKFFTCAHELGHYQYDTIASKSQSFECSKDNIGYGQQELQQKEIRANLFASELLMPKEFFLPEIRHKKPSWQLMEMLATKFNVSLQAATTRYIHLTQYTCWLVVAKNGKLQRFVKNDINEFKINLSSIFKQRSEKNRDWNAEAADNWLYGRYRTKNKELLCSVLSANQYGETLIFLWDEYDSLINDEPDDEFESGRDHHDFRKWH